MVFEITNLKDFGGTLITILIIRKIILVIITILINREFFLLIFFRCYAVTQTSLLLQRRQLPLEVIILIIMITMVVMVITMITMVVMTITMMVMVVIKEDCRNNTDPGNLGRWSTLGGKCWRLKSSLWQQVANH